jgi:hypothetical protein
MNTDFGRDPPSKPAPGTWISCLLQGIFGSANAVRVDGQSNLLFHRDQSSFELFARADGNYLVYTPVLRRI